MDNIFNLHSDMSDLNIKDAIHERLTKAQAITASLLASNECIAGLPNKFIFGAIWAVDDYLCEIRMLCEHLNH